MKRILLPLLSLIFLAAVHTSVGQTAPAPIEDNAARGARTAGYEGGYTQGAKNNRTYQWAGPTASTVTATMKVDKNNVDEQVVVFEEYSAPYNTTSWKSATQNFSIETRVRWHKNGGYTGSGANENSFVGWLKLDFDNPVPASEIFIRLYDMDNRGIDNVVPDGYIKFTGSEAGPDDFEQLVMSPAAPANATSSTYNSDGSIAFGVGAANADRNKYLALAGKTDKKVSHIDIFTRNIGDDVGIEIGWIKPERTALPVTLVAFDAKQSLEGVRLEWLTADEKDFDHFEIERSEMPQAWFGMIGTVPGGSSKYTFTDFAALNGAGYYRLKMVDTDGSFTYSKIVAVKAWNGTDLNKVYPNPSGGLNIYVNSASPIASYKVYDRSGREVTARLTNLGGKYEFTFGNDIRDGIYVLVYQAAGQACKQQFMLSR